MDCVLSGSLLVVFSLFCYAVCFLEQINSLSLSLSLSTVAVHGNMTMSQPRQFYLMIYTTKSGQHRQLKKQGKNCSAEDNTLQCN